MTTSRRPDELAIASSALMQVVVSLVHVRRAWVDEFLKWCEGEGIFIHIPLGGA
jgi:hypothetical protein